MQSMNSFGVMSFRGMYSRKAVTRPAKAPSERPAVGLQPIASEKLVPSKNPPT